MDVYTSDIQTECHAIDNQYSQSGRIDEKNGEAQLKKGIIPEQHAQSSKAHDRNQLPCNDDNMSHCLQS